MIDLPPGAAERVLLAAAVVPDEPGEARLREAVAEPVDWARVIRLADAHRLAPLVARRLRGQALDAAGRRAREQLEEMARRCVYANLLLAGELPGLLDRFAAAEIPVLVYKGPALALSAYGSLALRPYDDLDLVVRERDFERAKRTLLLAGLLPAAGDAFAAVRHLSHEQAFEARNRRLQVDLHGRLFPRELFAVDFEPLLARSVRFRLGEREVTTLGPEDLFVVVCEHAHKHAWVRLLWLSDLGRLAASGLDWLFIEEAARASGSWRVVGIGALLAAEWLAAPVPGELIARLRADRSVVALATTVARRLFAPPTGEHAHRELVRLQWRSRERWRDQLRYLWTPNESDWMLRPLPKRWTGAYHLVRPLRLLFRYRPRRSAREPVTGSAAAERRESP